MFMPVQHSLAGFQGAHKVQLLADRIPALMGALTGRGVALLLQTILGDGAYKLQSNSSWPRILAGFVLLARKVPISHRIIDFRT